MFTHYGYIVDMLMFVVEKIFCLWIQTATAAASCEMFSCYLATNGISGADLTRRSNHPCCWDITETERESALASKQRPDIQSCAQVNYVFFHIDL